MKRGRNQRRRQGVNINRALDSNGPDVRIRGTANQIYDKYLALARDASTSGDRVKAENYFQHAEHYFRLIRSIQPPQQAQQTPNDASEAQGEQPTIGDGGDRSRQRDHRSDSGRSEGERPDKDRSENKRTEGAHQTDGEAGAEAKSSESQPNGAGEAAASDGERAPRKQSRKRSQRRPKRADDADGSDPAEEAKPDTTEVAAS